MKKFSVTVLLAVLCVVLAVPAIAAPTTPVSDNIKLFVNGEEVVFPADDEQMYIDSNNRTMVPIRFPAETLGDKVTWNAEYQKVYIDQEETEYLPKANIMLTIESYMVVVNGETKIMDTLPTIVSRNTVGRTMVPARFISEYLGANVRWHNSSRAAHVFTEGQTLEEQDKIIIDTAKDLGINNPVIEDRQITTWDNLPPGAATEITPEIQERLYNHGYVWRGESKTPVEPLGYTAEAYPEAAKNILRVYPTIVPFDKNERFLTNEELIYMDYRHNSVIRGIYQKIEDNGNLYQEDWDIRIAFIRTEENPEWHWSDEYGAVGLAPYKIIKWGEN